MVHADIMNVIVIVLLTVSFTNNIHREATSDKRMKDQNGIFLRYHTYFNSRKREYCVNWEAIISPWNIQTVLIESHVMVNCGQLAYWIDVFVSRMFLWSPQTNYWSLDEILTHPSIPTQCDSKYLLSLACLTAKQPPYATLGS